MNSDSQNQNPAPQKAKRSRKERSSYAIQSLINAFDILEELSRSSDAVGISELSRRMKLHKNTIFRLLASLETKGYVLKDGERYGLAPKVVRLAQAYLTHSALVSRAQPILRKLVEQSGETVSLVLLDGLAVQFPLTLESKRSVRVAARSGMSLQAKFNAAGRLLLAHRPDRELVEITAGNSPQDVAIRNQLAELRHTGVIVDKGAIEADVIAIARVVTGLNREVIGAIEMLVPQYRGRIDGLLPLIDEAANLVSERMGAQTKGSALSMSIERGDPGQIDKGSLGD